MSSALSKCSKEEIRQLVIEAGALKAGFAAAEPVDSTDARLYDEWIADGAHGCLGYMERYCDVRRDPRLLLDGAKTVVSAAFSYYSPLKPADGALKIARYALGDDYHDVLRRRLAAVAAEIESRFGGATQVCIDTAPIRERYWAVRAGVGFTGRNGQLIVPGAGSYFFLAEIITTLAVEPDRPTASGTMCAGCDRCLRSCPSGALDGSGRVDARRCLSCLSIEYRGDFTSDVDLGDRLYGCDTCQEVCPHNANPPEASIPEFAPRPRLLQLDRATIESLDREGFSTLFRRSAIKRARLEGLQRNLRHINQSSRS